MARANKLLRVWASLASPVGSRVLCVSSVASLPALQTTAADAEFTLFRADSPRADLHFLVSRPAKLTGSSPEMEILCFQLLVVQSRLALSFSSAANERRLSALIIISCAALGRENRNEPQESAAAARRSRSGSCCRPHNDIVCQRAPNRKCPIRLMASLPPPAGSQVLPPPSLRGASIFMFAGLVLTRAGQEKQQLITAPPYLPGRLAGVARRAPGEDGAEYHRERARNLTSGLDLQSCAPPDRYKSHARARAPD